MNVIQIRSKDGTGTLTYLVVDEKSRQAVLIDPNIEDADAVLKALKNHDLKLDYIIDTHTHADHISGAEVIRHKTHAKIVMHEATKRKALVLDEGDEFGIGDTLRANAKIPINRYVEDGESIDFGTCRLSVLHTPGHTDNHIALLGKGNLFTGDLLLIGQAGRSDLPGGNAGEQYESLFTKILTLPAETIIHPGHDYNNESSTTLGKELASNPFLQHRTREEYIEFVKDFFPPIAESTEGGKVTLQCGVSRVSAEPEGYTDIDADTLHTRRVSGDSPFVLDVRDPHELVKVGALRGVVNIPVSQIQARLDELPDRTTEIVVVCQGGGRSSEAARMLGQAGFINVRNLVGGTGGWIARGFSVVKPEMAEG